MASVSYVYNKFVQSFLDHCIFLTSLCIVTEVPVYSSKQSVKGDSPDTDHTTNVKISVIKPPKETSEESILALLRCFQQSPEAQKKFYLYNGSTFCVVSIGSLIFMVDIAGLEYMAMIRGNGVFIIITYAATVSITFPSFLLLSMLSALRPGSLPFSE